MSKYVYLISDINNYTYKIGISKNPERRIKALQTGNDNKLKIIHKIEVRLEEDDGYTEDRNGYHNGIFVAVLQK